jgi:hypothetical protein
MTVKLTAILSSDLLIANQALEHALGGPFETEELARRAQLEDRLAPKGDHRLSNHTSGWHYDKITDAEAEAIHELVKTGNLDPFRSASVQFHVTMPILLAPGWPHYDGGVYTTPLQAYHPTLWGTAEAPVATIFEGKPIDNLVSAHFQACLRMYDGLVAGGVSPDQAALVLPLATEVGWYEVRPLTAYADIVFGSHDCVHHPVITLIDLIISETFPVAWEALESMYK